MIILSKIKILIVLSCLFVVVFMLFIQTSQINKANLGKTIPTVTLPVSGKVIVIDAGHGKPDERCRKFKRNN